MNDHTICIILVTLCVLEIHNPLSLYIGVCYMCERIHACVCMYVLCTCLWPCVYKIHILILKYRAVYVYVDVHVYVDSHVHVYVHVDVDVYVYVHVSIVVCMVLFNLEIL